MTRIFIADIVALISKIPLVPYETKQLNRVLLWLKPSGVVAAPSYSPAGADATKDPLVGAEEHRNGAEERHRSGTSTQR